MDCLTLKKSNCKNCYKCIRHCPVKSIRFSGNQAYIIGNECILCGQCFVVCPQNAKEIKDGTELVKVLLMSGEPVVASIPTAARAINIPARMPSKKSLYGLFPAFALPMPITLLATSAGENILTSFLSNYPRKTGVNIKSILS